MSFKGSSGLFVAVAVVVILLIMLPAYRWFFLISVGIGIVVAGILYLWRKYKTNPGRRCRAQAAPRVVIPPCSLCPPWLNWFYASDCPIHDGRQ